MIGKANNISGKKIACLIPFFYDYENLICQELKALGAEVILIENRAFVHDPNVVSTPGYLKFLSRKKQFIERTVLPAAQQRFDFLLCINLFAFDTEIINHLKKANPDIRCVLYLWDNLKGYHWLKYLRHFDSVYTFDPVDAKRYDLIYLPNFFPHHTETSNSEAFEFCSISSFQVTRLKVLKELARNLESRGRTYFFYLYLPPRQTKTKYNRIAYLFASLFKTRYISFKSMYLLYTNKVKERFVHNTSISLKASAGIIQNCQAVIDLAFPGQTGSSQRVIQALALKKKVLTTNESITKEPFFDSQHIQILQPNQLIDYDWVMATPSSTIDLNHLRIDNWLLTVLLSSKNYERG